MATLSSSADGTTTRARRTAGWVTGAGLAVLVGSALLAWSWRHELPDPVAIHWGANGRPNGFASLTVAWAVILVPGVLLVLGFGTVIALLGQSAVTRRIAAAASVWSALFLSLLTLGSLYIQRGLTDAREAGGLGVILAVATAASVVAAVVAAMLVAGDPRQPTTATVAADAPRVAVGVGERPTWTGRTDSGPVIGCGLAAVALVLGVAIVTRVWVVLVVAVVLAVVLAAMGSFVVRVDGTGLMVRSLFGWPRLHVPLDEVVRADVTHVHPLRDFGGWGLRVGRRGQVGVVLRRGEAVLVERTGGRAVVVTIDGAYGAAGLLNTLADRERDR